MSRQQTISLVTPSLNTAPFLRQTIQSVLSQRYPALQYVIADGGSSDGSREIIAEYRSQLHAVILEPDDGHADAINKGFARTSGDIMGWINSDDLLHQNSLATVDAIFAAFPEVDWITGNPTTAVDHQPTRIKIRRGRNFTYQDFLASDYEWLQQESTFWRRSLWDRAGGVLDTQLRLAVDFDLWMRFFRHARLHTVEALLGAFRRRDGQRSALHLDEYRSEVAQVIKRERGLVRSGAVIPTQGVGRLGAASLLRGRARQAIRKRTDRPSISRAKVDAALAARWVSLTEE